MLAEERPEHADSSPFFPVPPPIPAFTNYTRLGIGPESTAEEIRTAFARYVKLLRARGASEAELAEANGIGLMSTEQRAAFDNDHPPLELLKFHPTWLSLFDDRAQALAVLRRELEQFLLSRGVHVYFPTDVTRTDFTDDFTYSPLLDTVEDQGS